MTNDALLAFPFLPTLWKKRGASTQISLTTAEVTDSMFGAAGLLTRSWVSSNSQHPARYIGLPHIFADSVRYTRHTCHRGDIRAEKRSTWMPLPLDDRLGIYSELSALESVFTYRPPAMTLAANQGISQLVNTIPRVIAHAHATRQLRATGGALLVGGSELGGAFRTLQSLDSSGSSETHRLGIAACGRDRTEA